MNTIWRLEHLSYENRLRDGTAQAGERVFIHMYKYQMVEVKATVPGSSQFCPVTKQESMVTNWNTGNSTSTQKKTSSLWGWTHTRTSCSSKLWCLHPWRYSKLNGTWLWATCSCWPCSEEEAGLGDFQKYPPASAYLWFKDLLSCTVTLLTWGVLF